jgi:hypothetical protein
MVDSKEWSVALRYDLGLVMPDSVPASPLPIKIENNCIILEETVGRPLTITND